MIFLYEEPLPPPPPRNGEGEFSDSSPFPFREGGRGVRFESDLL